MAKITKLGIADFGVTDAFSKAWRKVGFGIGFPQIKN
jgi:hypothetical protein